MNFLCDLGRRITQSTDDHRESAFVFQLLSVLIQRYNVDRRCLGYLHPHNPRGQNVSVSAFVLVFSLQYNTIQYKNDFYSAVIEGAEALVGRL